MPCEINISCYLVFQEIIIFLRCHVGELWRNKTDIQLSTQNTGQQG